MKMQFPRIIDTISADGSRVSVDVSKVKMSKSQRDALGKIIAQGNHSRLTRREWDSVKDLRATIGGSGDEVAFIVRFDCKWCRIDARAMTFEEAVNPAVRG